MLKLSDIFLRIDDGSENTELIELYFSLYLLQLNLCPNHYCRPADRIGMKMDR